MKKNLLFFLAVGIGAVAFYSIFLDNEFLKKAVSLWFMEDNKGMQMLLVSKGSFAPIFSLFLVIIEVSFFPIHSVFMFQIVKDLYGVIIGFLYAFIGISICAFPLFTISKKLFILKFKPFVLFLFFIISCFLLPVPSITLFFIYICYSNFKDN